MRLIAAPGQLGRYTAEPLPCFGVFIDVNLTNRLRTLSTVDVYFGRLVAAAGASVQIWDFARMEYRVYKLFEAGGEPLIDQRYVFMHFQIAFVLLVASICLWSRRAGAFFVSILAAGWVYSNMSVGLCGRERS